MVVACSLRRWLVVGVVTAISISFTGNGNPACADDSQDVASLDLGALMDNIVLAASKHEETLDESPANVFLITRPMIELYGFTSIAEALSVVPGVWVADDYSLGRVGVRGAAYFGDWNSRIMVLVDGRPLSEKYGGTSTIDVPGIDIEHIERIEVIKGPSSSLYGSNAFFGIVNLITRKPERDFVGLASSYEAATDTKSLNLLVRKNMRRDQWFQTTASFTDRGGSDLFFPEFSDPGNKDLFALDDEGLNQYYVDSAHFSGGYAHDRNTVDRFSSHTVLRFRDFYLTGHFGRLNTGVAHSLWGSLFNHPANQFRERRHYIELEYRSRSTRPFAYSARVAYDYFWWADRVQYNYYAEDDDAPYLPGPLWIDAEDDQFFSVEVRAQRQWSGSGSVLVGAEAQFHRIRHNSGEAADDRETIPENVIPAETASDNGRILNAYGQIEHALHERVRLTAGLHFNHYSYTTGAVMPKGALVVSPGRNLTLKLIGSRGFRSPTFYELTFDDGYYYRANPDLKPETITNLEFIARREMAYGMSAEFSTYHSHMSDLIVQSTVSAGDPDHPGGDYIDEVVQFQNKGTQKANGIELAVARDPVYGVSGFANLTYQRLDVAAEEEAEFTSDSPSWLANVGLQYWLSARKASVSLRWSYISSRPAWDASRIPYYSCTDLHVGVRRVMGAADLLLGIKNLFDRRNRVPLSWDYAPSVSIERPGRSVFVRIRLEP